MGTKTYVTDTRTGQKSVIVSPDFKRGSNRTPNFYDPDYKAPKPRPKAKLEKGDLPIADYRAWLNGRKSSKALASAWDRNYNGNRRFGGQ